VERLAYLPAATFSATMGVLVSLLQATVPLSGFLILATADTISSETFVVLASLLCLLASVMFAKKFKELKRGKNDDKRNGEREPA
jgi:positive regulator of sigma E activity